MDEPARDVGSAEVRRVGVVHSGRDFRRIGRCALVVGPVGTLPVVMLDVLGERDFEVAVSEHEHAVPGTLAGRFPRTVRRSRSPGAPGPAS